MTDSDRVVIDYTNHRGERAARYITPLPGGMKFASNEWHPEPQWLLTAFDVDKQVWRDFAMKDIHAWSVPAEENETVRRGDHDLINEVGLLFMDAMSVKSDPGSYANAVIRLVREKT